MEQKNKEYPLITRNATLKHIQNAIHRSDKVANDINAWLEQYETIPRLVFDKRPTKKRLFYECSYSSSNAHDWLAQPKKYKAFNKAHKKAVAFIGMELENLVLSGGKEMIGAIFLLKTTFHYSDNKPVDNQTVNVLISSSNEGGNKIEG